MFQDDGDHDKGGKNGEYLLRIQITSMHKGRMVKMSNESRKGRNDANASEMKYGQWKQYIAWSKYTRDTESSVAQSSEQWTQLLRHR